MSKMALPRGRELQEAAMNRGTRGKADTPKRDVGDDLKKRKTLQLSNVSVQPLPKPEDSVGEDGLDHRGNISDTEDDRDADLDETNFARSGDKPPRKKPGVGVSQSEARERPSANEVKFPALGVPCEARCAKKCTTNISHERRRSIFDAYWSMSRHEQRLWVSSRVSRDLKHRDTTGPDRVSRRSMTYSYHLRADDGAPHEVCKTFFIATLGYHPKNDRFIVTAVRSASTDRRGRHVPSNKLDTGPIKAHIESFGPTVSQGKRERRPGRRRLPSSVTIRFMYGDFKDKNPGAKCSYETYRKVVGGIEHQSKQ